MVSLKTGDTSQIQTTDRDVKLTIWEVFLCSFWYKILFQGLFGSFQFLFMEPAEAQRMYTGGMDESISPRRSIATHRQTTPGGVNVTTTTMTTERMKDMRLDASFNGSCFISV